jgi:LuxR family transcriptional regulator, maltose regulon positive regulatory protein
MTVAVSKPIFPPTDPVLRSMPPRFPRNVISRPRLNIAGHRLQDRAVIVVQTPSGFGKTTLLGQWRREALARGDAVAWVTADGGEDSRRLLDCLIEAVRLACGRPYFGEDLRGKGNAELTPLAGVNGWLAELARVSIPTLLIIDETERLTPGNFAVLTYLLHNLAPNLQVVLGVRSGVELSISDLLDRGQAVALGSQYLRFHLDETIAVVRSRFGGKVQTDTAATLHELTEGWALGLQMLMETIEKGGDPRHALPTASTHELRRGDSFVENLLAQLPPDDEEFLIRISGLDLVHPQLCQAIEASALAKERLARLIRETPLFVVDGSEWVRVHRLVRDVLRQKLHSLPHCDQLELRMRATRWLTAQGLLHEAAWQAHAAGEHSLAYDLAEQCLHAAVSQGQQEKVLLWLELLPEPELHARPRLRVAAAWALALSERHGEAAALVSDLIDNTGIDPQLRCDSALVASDAAYYADDLERCRHLFEVWRDGQSANPPPRLQQMHANRQAAIEIFLGNPAQARHCIQAVPKEDFGEGYRYGIRWGHYFTGLSYLREGQVVLAEEVLRPALVSADADLGRHNHLSCMTAALLAAAVFERGQTDEAAEILANRLDVLKKVGTPDSVMLAYRTAARIAAAKGMENRAFDLLATLHAIGASRGLPRLCIVSLAEQIRFHACRFRSDSCRAAMNRFQQLAEHESRLSTRAWQQPMRLLQSMSQAYVALSHRSWPGVLEALALAAEVTDALKQGECRLQIQALRAYALEQEGTASASAMQEAITLAKTFGLARVFADTHPAVAEWAKTLEEKSLEQGRTPLPSSAAPRRESLPTVPPCMVLTPKERDVLEFLGRKFSNKEIAHAMAIAETTVKWHVKNLCGKLDAGSRWHAVQRAHALGLIEFSKG